jgi:hypothetical protein
MMEIAPAQPMEILQAAGLAMLFLAGVLAAAWLLGKWER